MRAIVLFLTRIIRFFWNSYAYAGESPVPDVAKKGIFEKVSFSDWKSDDFVLLPGEAQFLDGGAVGAATEKPYLGSRIRV